ncbi:MAG TPA: hypothetical protein VIJ82_04280 [Streptosporangiaceae bacterium]
MSDTTAFALTLRYQPVTGPGFPARALLLTVAEMDDLVSWWGHRVACSRDVRPARWPWRPASHAG